MLHLLILVFIFAFSRSEIPVCSTCKGTTCVLLPPDEHKHFPCYEGTPIDTAKCFKTDPLLKDNTTWACGDCASFGRTKYLQQDPIYKEMGLWVYPLTK